MDENYAASPNAPRKTRRFSSTSANKNNRARTVEQDCDRHDRPERRTGWVYEYGAVILIVFLCLLFSRSLMQVLPIVFIAAGVTFVILSGGIDLSVGAVASLSAVLSAGVLQQTGSMPLCVASCVAVGALLGLANGALVAVMKLPPAIATLGVGAVARSLGLIYSGGKPMRLPESFRAFLGGQVGRSAPFKMIAIVLLVYLASWYVVKKTSLGRILHTLASSEAAVLPSGVNIRLYRCLPYVISGALAGLGVLALMWRVDTAYPLMGTNYEIEAMTAIFIGGTCIYGGRCYIAGTLIGAIVLSWVTDLARGRIFGGRPVGAFATSLLIGAVFLIAIHKTTAFGGVTLIGSAGPARILPIGSA